MWSRTYRFGDIYFRIESEINYKESDRFLKFQTDVENYDFKIQVKNGEIPQIPEQNIKRTLSSCCWSDGEYRYQIRYLQTDKGMCPWAFTRENNFSAVQIYTEKGKKYLDARLMFDGIDFFGILNSRGAVTLHAAYVDCHDEAILFSGPSGIGKSTQAELWRRYRNAKIINGDRALICKSEGKFTANGICYAGTSGICQNISYPLRAIVILQQAAENRVRRLTGKEGFMALFPQCAFHKENVEEVKYLTATLAELLTEVPVYLLECTPDENAIEALEQVV